MIWVGDAFPSNMADLLQIESQAFKTPCDFRDFRAFFQSGGLCLLAVSGSLPCGYLMYRCLPDRRELWSMGVLVDSQRMGVGTALMTRLKQRVRQSPGLQTIDTWVAATNTGALRFLRAMGFHEVRRQLDVFDSGLAVLMRWPAQSVQKFESAAESSREE